MADQAPTIRLARRDDAPAVAEMWSTMAAQHRAYDPDVWCWKPEAVRTWRDEFADAAERDNMVCLVAERGDGMLCGFAQSAVKRSAPIFANDWMGEVWDLFVRPDCRGQGTGRALMEETFRRLREKGATKAILHVALENTAARKLYEKMGMRSVMVRMHKTL
ncbi:MAG: N-acetyltransferase family protein [Planctomycetota bacterium]